MRVVMKGAGLLVLVMAVIGIAPAGLAQASQPKASGSEQPGSVIVFPKFAKGTVTVDGVTKPRTEIEVRARCPRDAACPEEESVRIRFHWVCPGSEDTVPRSVCKEVGFDVRLSVNAQASFNPEDPSLLGNIVGSIAPCPSGYLIGWVISPTNRPIKYDGLTGSALLRDGNGQVESYEALAVRANPDLATRAEVATDIDPRTGSPALVFDGGPGHYQAVAEAGAAALQYHKLSGPLSSDRAFLVLLTLDVRVNRPNYPTFVDLDLRTDEGNRSLSTWHFTCWTEIQDLNNDAKYTPAGARIRNGVVLAGDATKVPVGGISDIPGPVTLLGLVPSDEGPGQWTMEPAYIISTFDGSKPTTVFLPVDSPASAAGPR